MYITKTSELENLCKNIVKSSFITIDTEFSREATYSPQLCLIQIATPSITAIIDALSPNIDLSSLDVVLQNKAVVKVFHSAKQDLEILYKIYGHLPVNIFDTQIAASFCGFGDYVSYEALVLQIVDKQIDKSYRLSDWTIRPLTEEQLEYAIGDVTYLREVYLTLLEKLKNTDRLSWAIEEMQMLNSPSNFIVNLEEVWQKIKNTRNLKVTLVLKKLATWREIKAQEYDLPRNHYLNEKHLLKLAEFMPITLKELRNINYFNEINEDLGNELITVIQKALEQQLEEDLKKVKKLSPSISLHIGQLAQLKLLLKFKSDKYQLPPQLLATTFELKSIYNDENILKHPRFLNGWRYEVFGKMVLELKKGDISLVEEDNKIKIIKNY